MINAFDQLKEFSDIGALKPALHSLLSRFGSVERLDILVSSQAGKRQALCFLRMGSAEQEHQITRELGVGRFAGDLVMIVDLKTPGTERDNAPTLQAA